VAENIASALYEISYLKAREQLDSVARKCHEKNKIQNIQKVQNIQNSQNAKYLQKMNSVKVDNDLRKSSVNGNGCISVFERNELAVAVKSVSRCLRVCWSVCGDVLNVMKRRKRRLNRNRIDSSVERITVSDDNNTAHDANYNNDSYYYKKDDDDGDNNSCNNNNNNNNNNTKNTYISKKKIFSPANRPTVDRLLVGLDERVFQPAISFSFTPPCPRGQK
jgi:hypothetical protein